MNIYIYSYKLLDVSDSQNINLLCHHQANYLSIHFSLE